MTPSGAPPVTLRAIGWDHPRCARPMTAAASAWRDITGVAVRWDFRPLTAFNDQPLAELARGYDLMIIDHPMIPEAVASGALRPLADLIGTEVLARLSADAVGPSGESYHYRGSQWALAVDAACQVSAGRRRELQQAAGQPASWPQALAAVSRLGHKAALPLMPADAFCALLTIAATLGEPVELGRPVSLRSLELLAELAVKVHPCSWACSPPQLLDLMRDGEDIVYAPLIFGYSTYAGPELCFFNAPASLAGRRRPVLGGAGLAISSRSDHGEAAAGFCTWVCGADTQHDIVLAAGGQPASRTVWSPSGLAPAGQASQGAEFFAATRASMDSSWMRPKDPRWADFQREGTMALTEGLRSGEPPRRIRDRLQQAASRIASNRSAA